MEVWMFYLYEDGGASVEVRKFDSKEDADLWVDADRNGRNVLYVRNADERDNAWRTIGARVIS